MANCSFSHFHLVQKPCPWWTNTTGHQCCGHTSPNYTVACCLPQPDGKPELWGRTQPRVAYVAQRLSLSCQCTLHSKAITDIRRHNFLEDSKHILAAFCTRRHDAVQTIHVEARPTKLVQAEHTKTQPPKNKDLASMAGHPHQQQETTQSPLSSHNLWIIKHPHQNSTWPLPANTEHNTTKQASKQRKHQTQKLHKPQATMPGLAVSSLVSWHHKGAEQ